MTFLGYNVDYWFFDDIAVVDTAPALVRATVTGVSPDSGPTAGGQTVTITGTHFTGASRVMFDHQLPAASFTVDSPTQITAVTPAHATGVAHVRVHTVGLSATSPANRYKYVVS